MFSDSSTTEMTLGSITKWLSDLHLAKPPARKIEERYRVLQVFGTLVGERRVLY